MKRTIRRIAGFCILGTPFVALYIAAAVKTGQWGVAALPFLAAAVLLGVVSVGLRLAFD